MRKAAAIRKPPATAPAILEPRNTEPDRAAIIDEYGRLSTHLKGLNEKIKRQEQLRKMILTWYTGGEVDQAFDEDGQLFSVHIGPCALQRSIRSMVALKDRLGLTKFLKLCSFSLERLDTVLLPEDQSTFVVQQRTGPRTVIAIAKFTESR